MGIGIGIGTGIGTMTWRFVLLTGEGTRSHSAYGFIGKTDIFGRRTRTKCGGAWVSINKTWHSHFVPREVIHYKCADPQPGDRILALPECDECNGGDSIKIGWCGSTSRQQFTRVGSTLRPKSDQSLCMTSTGHSESSPIRLYDCDDDDSDQKFEGFRNDGRFELHPRDEPDRCVSQLREYTPFFPI